MSRRVDCKINGYFSEWVNAYVMVFVLKHKDLQYQKKKKKVYCDAIASFHVFSNLYIIFLSILFTMLVCPQSKTFVVYRILRIAAEKGLLRKATDNRTVFSHSLTFFAVQGIYSTSLAGEEKIILCLFFFCA